MFALSAAILAARVRVAPMPLRRLLAPYDGLALWAHWLLGLNRARRARQRAAARLAASRATGSDRAAATPPVADPSTAQEVVRDLASLTIGEVMIPRSEVVALEGRASVRHSIEVARRAPHALFPVYGDGVDQPLGVVRMIDLSGAADVERPVRELVRPVPIFPETMRCLALLPRLADSTDAAAFVVDEFGGLAGCLTIEDLIEVVVGDFVGEHETERRRIVEVSSQNYRVEGSCRVDEFNHAVGEVLPEGEYETVAGLFLDRFGRIPVAGDEVALAGARLEIGAATDRRVLWLTVELLRGKAVARS
ncbi:MAG: transporter associated domain-containing protein [Candidatus Eisenbacteria bacterium]